MHIIEQVVNEELNEEFLHEAKMAYVFSVNHDAGVDAFITYMAF